MKNYFLLSTLLVLISAFAVSQLGIPSYENVKQKQTQLKSLDSTLNNSEMLQVLKDEKFTIYNSIPTSNINIIENAVPAFNSSNVVKTYLDLNRIITSSGLPSSTSFGQGKEVVENFGDVEIIRLPFTFRFDSTNYFVFQQFVQRLVQWERGTIIRSISIQEPINNPGISNIVRAELVLDILFTEDDKI